MSSSNQPQVSRWDYLNYDQKVTKVSGNKPDTIEFGRIKFRLKVFPKLFHIKTFWKYCKSSKNAPGVYLVIDISEGFYWKEPLKEEALKKLEIVKS